MPAAPPPLHTRSGNEQFERPKTPTQQWFTSPAQTPQGSPSKKQMPPGANHLPELFQHAMKLTPITQFSPTKIGRPQQTPPVLTPRGKNGITADDTFTNADDTVKKQEPSYAAPSSPTRKSNKENNPPGSSPKKEGLYLQSSAAVSRQELYQPREQPQAKKGYDPQRGLTAEELEKLQSPQVKRLANVTQLCKTYISLGSLKS